MSEETGKQEVVMEFSGKELLDNVKKGHSFYVDMHGDTKVKRYMRKPFITFVNKGNKPLAITTVGRVVYQGILKIEYFTGQENQILRHFLQLNFDYDALKKLINPKRKYKYEIPLNDKNEIVDVLLMRS